MAQYLVAFTSFTQSSGITPPVIIPASAVKNEGDKIISVACLSSPYNDYTSAFSAVAPAASLLTQLANIPYALPLLALMETVN